MRRLVPLVLLLPMVLAPVPSAAGPGVNDGPRCQGIRATIVGKPDVHKLRGTARPDVIVSNGSRYVDALNGNDRVCITKRGARVRAGGGDDVVKVLTNHRRSGASLGTGRDVYVGGGHRDEVWGGDDARDVIRTGAGRDHVIAGAPDGMGDRVSLGSGPDLFDLRSVRTIGDGRVSGGPGTDTLRGQRTIPGGEVVIDAEAGTGTRDGTPFLSFAGLEEYTLDFTPGSAVTFVGSDRDEYAYFPRVTIGGDLGDGDDTIVGDFGPAGTEEQILGGGGADRLVLEGGDVVFDAADGTAQGGPTLGTAAFGGFEWLHGIGPAVTMNGSGAGETLVAFGCEVAIHGLGGDDTLTSYAGSGALDEWNCADTTSELFGDAGDDVMVGADRTDVLIGGDGDDSADGGRGEDVCEAETRVRCEG